MKQLLADATSVRGNESDPKNQQPNHQPRKRGRRAQYDWQTFAAEMVRRAAAGELPEKQAEFERQMLEWCATRWGREPSESQVREWVAAALQALRPDGR